MKIITKKIRINMDCENDIKDVTEHVSKIIYESGLLEGSVTIFASGSTGAISTMEYEPGLKKDVPSALEKIAPTDIDYEHHKTWHDDNGRGHVKSTIVGSSLTIPFIDGKLVLGTWQQIVLLNFDTRPRERMVVVQVIGE